MSKKSSYGWTMLGYAAVIIVPIAALAWASTAKAVKGTTGGKVTDKPVLKPQDIVPDVIKKATENYFSKRPDPEEVATVAGWFLYAGRWIRVDEFLANRTVQVEDAAFIAPTFGPEDVKGVTYNSKFRWTVMMGIAGQLNENAQPLATEVVYETGEASVMPLTAGPRDVLEAEARAEAIAKAADVAVKWINLAFKLGE